MSYSPTVDLLALLRQTSRGTRTVRMPGLDYVIAAMARAGLFTLYIGQTAPVVNQSTTVWFLPAPSSWVAEGAVFLWNAATGQYEPATLALWSAQLTPGTVLQDVTTAGPVTIGTTTTILRVLNVGAAVALVLPPSANKFGGVLVVDWANLAGTNAIQISLSGGDTFPNGAALQTINGDGGSIFLRPVPGGYVL